MRQRGGSVLKTSKITPSPPSRRVLLLVVVAVSVVISGCASGASLPPVDDLPALTFGTGDFPATIPEEFPLPEHASVGSTMVDGTRVRTEVVIIFGADAPQVVAFYEAELPDAGYEVSNSTTDGTQTDIEFTGNGIEGTMTIKAAGPGLSEGFLVTGYS